MDYSTRGIGVPQYIPSIAAEGAHRIQSDSKSDSKGSALDTRHVACQGLTPPIHSNLPHIVIMLPYKLASVYSADSLRIPKNVRLNSGLSMIRAKSV